jgi:hypothetical protein
VRLAIIFSASREFLGLSRPYDGPSNRQPFAAFIEYLGTALPPAGLPLQGFAQEHFDVGLVSDALLGGQAARRVNVFGRQSDGHRPQSRAGGNLAEGQGGTLPDAALHRSLQFPPMPIVPLGVFRFRSKLRDDQFPCRHPVTSRRTHALYAQYKTV